jgi:hypothetical protein
MDKRIMDLRKVIVKLCRKIWLRNRIYGGQANKGCTATADDIIIMNFKLN